MANKTNSMSHTKWMCKYHIVFIPKYRRKAIYGQYMELCDDSPIEVDFEEITEESTE